MKKFLPLIAIVVLLAIGAIVMATQDKDKTASNSPNGQSKNSGGQSAKKFSPPNACDVLTLEDAKKVLGESAEKTVLPGDGSASSDDVEVTQCFYSQPSGDTLASIKAAKQASILVRGAKTEIGAESNDVVFHGAQKPAGVQDVNGYGDAAFWNPQFGQFNIYKNGNWYILSAGVSTPAEKTLEEAKVLADAIIGKL